MSRVSNVTGRYTYCRLVAGSIGRLSLAVFGGRGRVYLPVTDANVRVAHRTCRAMTRSWPNWSPSNARACTSGSSAIGLADMAGIYYRLLVHIERDPMAVTQRRLLLPAAAMVWIAGKCLLVTQP